MEDASEGAEAVTARELAMGAELADLRARFAVASRKVAEQSRALAAAEASAQDSRQHHVRKNP